MPEVTDAYALYCDPEYRSIFSALALGNAHEDTVALGLDVLPAVFAAFKYLFFDVSVFPHNPAKARFVREIQSDEMRKYFELAIERGVDELIERYRIGARPPLDPDKVIQGVLSDSWGKFTAHRGYAVTTEVAKEAFKWGQAALRAALVEREIGKDKAISPVADLKIALKITDDTKSLDDLKLDPDELISS